MNPPSPAMDFTPSAPARASAPSVHERALVTWAAIFPLVAVSQWALAPLVGPWNPVLRAFVLTLVVVPAAVYLVVPRLMGLYLRLTRR